MEQTSDEWETDAAPPILGLNETDKCPASVPVPQADEDNGEEEDAIPNIGWSSTDAYFIPSAHRLILIGKLTRHRNKRQKTDDYAAWPLEDALLAVVGRMLTILDSERTKFKNDKFPNPISIVKYLSTDATEIRTMKWMYCISELPAIYDNLKETLEVKGKKPKESSVQAFLELVRMERGKATFIRMDEYEQEFRRRLWKDRRRTGLYVQAWLETYGVGLTMLSPSHINKTLLSHANKADMQLFLDRMNETVDNEAIRSLCGKLDFIQAWMKTTMSIKDSIPAFVLAVDDAIIESNLDGDWW